MTSLVSKTENANTTIALMPIDSLRPHEKGSPIYLELLRPEILRDGMLRYPIIADEKTHVILDGMHRWLALKSIGCTLIPVMLVSVSENSVRVGTRRIHRYTGETNTRMTVQKVIETGLSGHLMKPRSTRHFFSFSKFTQVNYPLNMLEKGQPQDVSKYLATVGERECNLAVKEWLDEISEELEFLTRKKEEVKRERVEFLNRVKNLDKHFLYS